MTKKILLASLLGLSLSLGTGSLFACSADMGDMKSEGKACTHDKAACAAKDKHKTSAAKKAEKSEKVAEKKAAAADKAAL